MLCKLTQACKWANVILKNTEKQLFPLLHLDENSSEKCNFEFVTEKLKIYIRKFMKYNEITDYKLKNLGYLLKTGDYI